MDLKERVHAHREQIIRIRRDLHRVPEIAYEEKQTSAYVARCLREQGLSVSTGMAQHGVVGLLETGVPGPGLLIRADMDALLVREETGLPFASAREGAMHACGHDGHMAMVLGAAMV
ncbi:MAG: M20/M25/M40 family metallo-hydrolase, partial [Thermodesulfobacteriota bacterium]